MNIITQPRSWWASRNAKKTYEKNLQEGWDVVLPPVEVIKPSLFGMLSSNDNWGNVYLEVDKYKEEMKAKLQRKVVVFVLDTAGKFTNPYLLNHSWNYLGASMTGESDPTDINGHGTHCAGIIVGDHPTNKLGKMIVTGKLTCCI